MPLLRSDTAYAAQKQTKQSWAERLRNLQPWDEINDPIALPLAIPMPVQISSAESLQPFFNYLRDGRLNVSFKQSKEPYYDTDMLEFERGAHFRDGRLDLCKMVVGPDHINSLMTALESNTEIRHFLLGNNIIGPRGATRIAQFIDKKPDQIETWYLAGNCITAEAFTTLTDGFAKSSSVHSVWLKRNPLTSQSADDIIRLLTETKVRTLDLDQTELGDEAVAKIFTSLTGKTIALRNIYLNGCGVAAKACKAINGFLRDPACQLEYLFLANNPIGDAGLVQFSPHLRQNRSLKLLSLRSCGLKDVNPLLAEIRHTNIISLALGQSYATPDLGTRFNYLTDDAADGIIDALPNLRYLDIGQTYITHDVLINRIGRAILQSQLLHVDMSTVLESPQRWHYQRKAFQTELNATLERNIKEYYGPDMTVEHYTTDKLRWWKNTTDARVIDSVYRNRDAGMARRGQLVQVKFWEADKWEKMREQIV